MAIIVQPRLTLTGNTIYEVNMFPYTFYIYGDKAINGWWGWSFYQNNQEIASIPFQQEQKK